MHPTTTGGRPNASVDSPSLNALFSKINWRIIPLLLIAYMVAYLDRINIGYAQLQMKQTLPFSDAVFGAVEAQSTHGKDFFRYRTEPPIDQIEVMRGFVHQQAAGILFLTMPTAEVIGAMVGIQQPLKFHGKHAPDCAAHQQMLDLGARR